MNNRYRRTIRPKTLRRTPATPALLAFSGGALVILVGVISFLAIDVPSAQRTTVTNGATGRPPATGAQPPTAGPAAAPTTSNSPGSAYTPGPAPKDAAYYETSSNPPAPPAQIVVTSTPSPPPPTSSSSTPTPTPTPTVTIVFPIPTGGDNGGYNHGGGHSGGGHH